MYLYTWTVCGYFFMTIRQVWFSMSRHLWANKWLSKLIRSPSERIWGGNYLIIILFKWPFENEVISSMRQKAQKGQVYFLRSRKETFLEIFFWHFYRSPFYSNTKERDLWELCHKKKGRKEFTEVIMKAPGHQVGRYVVK